jgi:hypothetical protein
MVEAAKRLGMDQLLPLLVSRYREAILRAGGEFTRAVDSLRIGQLPVDSGSYYLARGEVASHQGRPAGAYFDSARVFWAHRLRAPLDSSTRAVAHRELGSALAGLGLTNEALAHADTAVLLMSPAGDPFYGTIMLDYAMRIAFRVGAIDEGVAKASRLLAMPSLLSRELLQVDLVFADARGRPGFQQLLRR